MCVGCSSIEFTLQCLGVVYPVCICKLGRLHTAVQSMFAATTLQPLISTPAALQDGRRVLLLERDLSQPDRIVGELLQPGGYLQLKRLGLAACCDGIDSQKASDVHVPFPPTLHRAPAKGMSMIETVFELLCQVQASAAQ